MERSFSGGRREAMVSAAPHSAAASCKSVWHSLKNCTKILIGLNINFNERSSFLRQYALHLTGFRPMRKITCPGLTSEGAGSEALMIMNAITFARSSGLAYLHSPFLETHRVDCTIRVYSQGSRTDFAGLFCLASSSF